MRKPLPSLLSFSVDRCGPFLRLYQQTREDIAADLRRSINAYNVVVDQARLRLDWQCWTTVVTLPMA